MIAYIQRMTTGEVSVAPAAPIPDKSPEIVSESPPEPTASTLPVVSGNDEIESKLIEVVVKHTGYPADFIEMDQDLEGELGIDTVKQAEIMSEEGYILFTS